MIPMQGGIPQYGGYGDDYTNEAGGMPLDGGGGAGGFDFSMLSGLMGGGGGKKKPKFQQMQGDQHAVPGQMGGGPASAGYSPPLDMSNFSGFLRYLSLLNTVMGY